MGGGGDVGCGWYTTIFLLPLLQGASSQPSILDRDKTATAILEMAGKTRHSEGLREPEEGEGGT